MWKKYMSIYADYFKLLWQLALPASTLKQEGYSLLKWLHCLLGNGSTYCTCDYHTNFTGFKFNIFESLLI